LVRAQSYFLHLILFDYRSLVVFLTVLFPQNKPLFLMDLSSPCWRGSQRQLGVAQRKSGWGILVNKFVPSEGGNGRCSEMVVARVAGSGKSVFWTGRTSAAQQRIFRLLISDSPSSVLKSMVPARSHAPHPLTPMRENYSYRHACFERFAVMHFNPYGHACVLVFCFHAKSSSGSAVAPAVVAQGRQAASSPFLASRSITDTRVVLAQFVQVHVRFL
jgi:hypothetical protein